MKSGSHIPGHSFDANDVKQSDVGNDKHAHKMTKFDLEKYHKSGKLNIILQLKLSTK